MTNDDRVFNTQAEAVLEAFEDVIAEGRATEVSISLTALYLPGGQIKILPDLIEQSQPRRED